jgi:hypothetical protein
VDRANPPRPDVDAEPGAHANPRADRDAAWSFRLGLSSVALLVAFVPAHDHLPSPSQLLAPAGMLAGWLAILRGNAARAAGSTRTALISWGRGLGILTGIVLPIVLLAALALLAFLWAASDWEF